MQMQRLTSTIGAPSRQSLQTAAEALGGTALIAAVALACMWLLKRLWSFVGGSSGKRGGYYVRDRSLGGKTVFIEDQPAQRREVQPAPYTETSNCKLLPACFFADAITGLIALLGGFVPSRQDSWP